MFTQVHLTERHHHILWATIRHYIATAEPVGSKALVEEYNLKVSPATIRNGMGVLERAGLLYQPHTSAGRIPSDSGYRIYVDKLITPSETFADEALQLLREQLNLKNCSLEAVLRGASQILSTLSGYITLVTLPKTVTTRLRHLHLVSIEPGKIMLVVVTDSYQTQSSLIDLSPANSPSDSQAMGVNLLPEDQEVLEQELQLLSNFLNAQLRGKSISELSILDWSELDREFQCYSDFLRKLLTDLSFRSQTPEYTRILISGIAEVLHLPEFSQLQQVKTLMHLLEEEQEQLWPLIFPNPKQEQRVTVRIGSENPLEPIQGCTLVSAPYRRDNIPVGSVGILGPTRMMYENAIAVVEAAADYLSEALS
ncbi:MULTISPECIES: heat-inducible transcriptional repressor HrcA [Planktothrix]|jgi:heat-inducible transcriptional repressor|uniref:Heat-inducible transcription repressor HrcA n=2 Tax=Planktothrix agardhii TaxID=1160 RepID=A0A073CHZ3_PLAA1|nr:MULTISPECIES: heat-inducible transcriptional repressor HrcA [Planktothrix]MCF3606372.1 heat-inducible transcriptional repressor HrcA [Planktothrix agardhii 1033]BBD56263.1 heat-inducible transcription repressor HrcA [Planktothrix agardhii NIES-204]KEI67919.1 HrcA [Planktothrix agardhii NIVA-CYA 126/8]MBG0746403.1 heat-inducible transcriptional repressor HrcA [Planktothrix agardhii KL2]MCB8764997.1 heat-inducible transcriptional repressor HrcA [Planktothrix agardhii 1809]